MIDTDVLIEVLRARDTDVVDRWRQTVESGDVPFFSPVTAAELWRGVRPSEVEFLSEFLANMACIAIDNETGRLAGRFLQKYHSSHGLEMPDALIAAGAVQHNLPLWTRNRKHYPMKELHLL